MGRYTVEITVNSVARTVVCVDVTGATPRITQVTGPTGSTEPEPPIDLAMLMAALRPAERESASGSDPRHAVADSHGRPRHAVRRWTQPQRRGGPISRRPVTR